MVSREVERDKAETNVSLSWTWTMDAQVSNAKQINWELFRNVKLQITKRSHKPVPQLPLVM